MVSCALLRRLPMTLSSVVMASAALVLTAAVATVLVGLPTPSAPASVSPVVNQANTSVAEPPRVSRTRPIAPPVVKPLGALQTPDLLISAPRRLTADQLTALKQVRGVVGLSLLDVGTLRIGAKTFQAAGVDPSEFRAFTPRETASSDPLWAAVARGDLAPSYGSKLPLGDTLIVAGSATLTKRVGALAAYGLPGTDVVVDRATARSLGLQASTVVLAAPERGIAALQDAVRAVIGSPAEVTVLRPAQVRYERPSNYRALYQAAARYCPGLSWTVLAAIGQVESGHGVNVGPSSAGALGPMQFLPSTWAFAGVDGDGDGKADIMSPYDAVPAAALYLCRNGAGRGGQSLYDAIFSYNHADWYVREVLALAAQYK